MAILKKGFEDAFIVMIVLFTIAIVFLVLLKAWNSMSPELSESITSVLPENSSVNATESLSMVGGTIIMGSNLLPFILIGLFAFVFLGTAIYFNHPIMIFVGILILGVAILLGAIYSNVYNEISSSNSFSTENSQLHLQELFMKYLPIIILLIFICITAAVIYLRQGTSGGNL